MLLIVAALKSVIRWGCTAYWETKTTKQKRGRLSKNWLDIWKTPKFPGKKYNSSLSTGKTVVEVWSSV